MEGTRRAVVVGVVVALAAGALLGGAVFWLMRTRGPLARVSRPDRVVIVFSGSDADGVQVAQAVAVLDTASGTWSYPDPMKKVTVAGTTYNRLRDAYPFGGAEAVAAALGARGRIGWVDVPQQAWETVVAPGVTIAIPRRMNVFDGTRLTTFEEGSVTVPSTDVTDLMNGVAYLAGAERAAITPLVARASVAALASHGPGLPAGASTNMGASALDRALQEAP